MLVTRNKIKYINYRIFQILSIEATLRGDKRKSQEEEAKLDKERTRIEAEIKTVLEKKATDNFDRQDKNRKKYERYIRKRKTALSGVIENIKIPTS